MKKALFLVFAGATLTQGCQEEPGSIGQDLPAEVRFLTLKPSVLTNFTTLIANGSNFIEFTVEFLDKDQNPLFLRDQKVTLLVDGTQSLGYPYHFTTTEPGHHIVKIKDVPQEALIVKGINIMAQAEPAYDPVTLPVIFHYVKEDTSGWVPNQREAIHGQLAAALRIVNDAFANRAGSPDPNAQDARINFVLAEQDPEGNHLQYPGVDFVKALGSPYERIGAIDSLIWDGNFWLPARYVNVWVLELSLGWSWAYFPEYEPSSSPYPTDPYGVVLNKNAILNETVLAHELGHYLDLRHVFDVECADPDFCDDTWSYKRTEFLSAWKLIRTSCSGDSFTATNRMDYGETQNNTFTLQQVKRMRFAFDHCPFIPSGKNQSTGGRFRAGRSRLNDMKTTPSLRRVIN